MTKPVDIANLIKAMVVISDHYCEKLGLPVSFPALELQHPDLIKIAQYQSEQLLSPEDAARMMGVSPKTIANWRYRGTEGPKYVNIGSRIAYRRKDVLDFITDCVRQSTSEVKTPLKKRR